MKFFRKFLIAGGLFLVFLTCGAVVPARKYVTEWYIKDIRTEININQDGSIDVDEKIAADCGDLADRHGIYRTLPTLKYLTDEDVVQQKASLQSITDFDGNSLKYTESQDKSNNTITWKIGDANKTVKGENDYEIKYNVSNVILGNSDNFDEFYWNVHGQFWDMEADQAEIIVNFPENFDYQTQETNLYGGTYGSQESIASYQWLDNNTIEIKSSQMLSKYEGLTLSVTIPKGMTATAPVQKLSDINKTPIILVVAYYLAEIFWAILLIIGAILTWYYWLKYGRDPVINKTTIAQYEPPMNLNPMQMGMLISNGDLKSKFITASIVNMAVKKIIKIEDKTKKGWFGSKDYKLISLKDTNQAAYDKLEKSEKDLYYYLFGNSTTKLISSLKDKFYSNISSLKSQVQKELIEEKLLYERKGFDIQTIMFIVGIMAVIFPFILLAFFPWLALLTILEGIMMIIFSFWMPKHTLEGAEEQWKAKGFKLFMLTAEKYRQQFYEDENIFERYLPYAIVFNIVKKWAKNMENIYGKEKMSSYSPYWYSNSLVGGGFDVDSFTNSLTAMSSEMSSTISSSPSSSGSGGGGFSGGGGGGGGGGGW
ncbi:MAG TPA: DUF2207 domain-containing protein [bacterium]|nr:DUF2207 domain-containing protein [bacterium]